MNKMNELRIRIRLERPDIICICESWAHPEVSDNELSIMNYTIVNRKNRGDIRGGRGGGLLVYVKDGLVTETRDTNTTFNEVIALTIRNTLNQKLHIYLMYRSPNSDLENNSELNRTILRVPANSLLVGDFNYPDIDWNMMDGSGQSAGFIDCCQSSFLDQSVEFLPILLGTH
jgi:Endonuclease/Exonuclease/phosphatase family.